MSDHLLELEQAFWFGDAEFYGRNLATHCRMAFPGAGLLGRETAIAGIGAGPRWDDVEMSDLDVALHGEGCAVLSYRARAKRDGVGYRALVGSVYVLEAGVWKLAYHQHSTDPDEGEDHG